MSTLFETALAFTLPTEGGFVNDPDDSGGATNHGITQVTYDRYRLSLHEMNQSVQSITDDEVSAIYEQVYWTPAHCAEMPLQLAVCHFDWAVNHGVAGAIKTLQQVLSVADDGVFGPQTSSRLQQSARASNLPILIGDYLDARRAWYEQRVMDVPSQMKFKAGWLHRVNDLQTYVDGLQP